MERPSSLAFFMLYGSLLLATSRQCAAAPIIGTQTQTNQLVEFIRSATDASIAHLQVRSPILASPIYHHELKHMTPPSRLFISLP
jgi:hypothetical protein